MQNFARRSDANFLIGVHSFARSSSQLRYNIQPVFDLLPAQQTMKKERGAGASRTCLRGTKHSGIAALLFRVGCVSVGLLPPILLALIQEIQNQFDPAGKSQLVVDPEEIVAHRMLTKT